VEFIETGDGITVVSLVCEDLAQIDDVADVVRSVGPTMIYTPVLDGPQLSSRWAARYASVLADDPGSAVVTLTSYGMVLRSRPHGRALSPVVGLWKDPVRGPRNSARARRSSCPPHYMRRPGHSTQCRWPTSCRQRDRIL